MDKIIYLDCFSGISGDMTLGALLDLGFDVSYLTTELKKLPIEGYEISVDKINGHKISCTDFKVKISGGQPSRNYSEIKGLINNSSLKESIKQRALSIFEVLADAESKIHQVPMDMLHFHEVGAVDSIIDIVGTAIGFDYYNPDKIFCSPVPLGSGFINAAHGKLPVPAPATAEILKDIPVYTGDFDFEVTTPTGAAIIKSSATSFCKLPLLKISGIGYGSGSRKNTKVPNLLRIILGVENNFTKNGDNNLIATDAKSTGFDFEELVILSANIDDLSAELMGFVTEKILKEGALDVWTEPVFMKKNRQATKLTVLCKKEDDIRISKIIFKETTTLGIRRVDTGRYFLERKEAIVKLPYGEIKVKLGYLKGEIITCSPEYESCAKLARKTKKPLREIYRDAGRFFSKR